MVNPQKRLRELEKCIQKKCRNVSFEELCKLLEMFGWVLERVANNNHYYYTHPEYPEYAVNIARPHKGNEVKPFYCIRAIKNIKEIMDDYE